MLRRIVTIIGYVLLVAAIVVVVVLAHRGAESHRNTQQVAGFSINVDGVDGFSLVDEMTMHSWFHAHNVHPEGRTVADVNLSELEGVALQHSAVAKANAYVTYDGYVQMNIVQREPIMRLRMEGYDSYLSRDGHLFATMRGYAAYVPVITGNYRMIFDGSFTGSVAEFTADTLASLHREIEYCEHRKYPIYRDKSKARSRFKSVSDSTINRPIFMSDAKYESLCEGLKLYKEAYAQRYEAQDKEYDEAIARLTAQQQQLYDKINEIRKRESDFRGLERFVNYVLADEFWSAEITQVVISESGNQTMQLSLIPRSGSFVVDMGDLNDIETKFSSLRLFYDKVLSSVGWDAYNHISLRYDGQVVCREAR